MKIKNDYYMIVDLEATCSDDGAVPREEMEIIEIGAVMLNAKSFVAESEFQSFVRPVRHPQLTRFCTQLTGIKQEDLQSCGGFPVVLDALKEWAHRYNHLFCSWGAYDRKQFEQDCLHHKVKYPFTDHMNLKACFADVKNLRRQCAVGQALSMLGMKFEGNPHRGIDDARNIARIVGRVVGNS